MADIQTGRWGRLVQAAFNLKQALTLGQAMPDVLPVFDLTQPDPSLRYHANDDYCTGQCTVPAVAGQYGWGILQLPPNSGRIVVVEEVVVWAGVALGFQLTIGGGSALVGAAPTPYSQFADSRRAGRPSAALRTSSAVALGPNAAQYYPGAANTAVRFNGPFILSQTPVAGLPSPFLVVEGNIVNTQFLVNFRWRERTMEPAEYRVS